MESKTNISDRIDEESIINMLSLKETIELYEKSKVVFSTTNLVELFKVIVDSILIILKADNASLMLLDEENKLYIAYSSGLTEDIQRKTRLAIGERIAGSVAEKKQPVILIGNLKNDPKFTNIAEQIEIKSSIVFPLIKVNDIMGVINISRIKVLDNFTEIDLYKTNIFTSFVILSIENARLYKELQKSQSQLIQSEKMAVVGQLAGGVAHELNNPLTIILGLVQLVCQDMDTTTQKYNDLKDVESAALRCKKIINSLSTFARMEDFNFKLLNVNEVVENALLLSGRQFELGDIRIEKLFADNIPSIFGDIQKLEQVFINLILNAIYAMHEGAVLNITTEYLKDSDSHANGEVRIIFSDTGTGILEVNMDKLFIPFFTTKPVGAGSGLGLSVCKGIAEKHNGRIEVKSKPGEGSVFTVILPVKENFYKTN